MNESQRDDLIIETHGLVAGISAKLTALEARVDDHTGRITLVEGKVEVHSGWRSRLVGAWVAVAVAAGIGAAIAAIAIPRRARR